MTTTEETINFIKQALNDLAHNGVLVHNIEVLYEDYAVTAIRSEQRVLDVRLSITAPGN